MNIYILMCGLFATFLVVGFQAVRGTGIQCYVCDSAKDADCVDHFDKSKEHVKTAFFKSCSDWCSDNKGIVPAITDANGSLPANAVPCPAEFISCRKIKQSSTGGKINEGKPVDRIIRACGFVNDSKNYVYRAGGASKSEVFTCVDDGCNSGSSLVATFLTIFGAIFAVFAFKA